MYISILAALVAIYLFFLMVLFFAQDKLIFLGAKPNYLLYKKLECFSEDIVTDNCLIQGWKTEGASPVTDTVIIYFGGNAEDTSGMLANLRKLNARLIYTFNYRGYGLSEGVSSELNIFKDALEIYNHVAKSHPNKKIVVIGHSLGSAVAGYLASNYLVEKLILLSPLSSLTEIAQLHLKNIFPGIIVKHKFDLKKHVQRITAETLVVLAENDFIIPNKQSLKTYNNLTANKQLAKISNAGHNDLFIFDETFEKVNQFISSDKQV